jgi:hypothetical protein
VWLGGRGRIGGGCRLAVSRLVKWRLVAELMRPIRKALMEMAAAAGRRQLVALPLLNFPFVGTLSLPAVVACRPRARGLPSRADSLHVIM